MEGYRVIIVLLLIFWIFFGPLVMSALLDFGVSQRIFWTLNISWLASCALLGYLAYKNEKSKIK